MSFSFHSSTPKGFIKFIKFALSILRNNNKIQRELKFIKTSSANTIKTGLLVKERMLGIGTMTFYDPETKTFGALGHKLMDNDFSCIADINSGTLLKSKVTGINKSSYGNVGEILASIYEKEKLGTIYANTQYGVFGYYDTCPDKEALEVEASDVIQIALIVIILALLAFVIFSGMKTDDVEEVEEELSVESLLQSTPSTELENIELETKSETRKLIEKFVDENPEAAANLLRNWLNEDWGL